MKKILLTLTILIGLLNVNSVSAHPGIGIVMDSYGNVYYTDLVHVWKISKDGKLSIAVKNVHTHELYIDNQNNLYGEHSWYEGETTDKYGYYLWCLSEDGVFQKTTEDTEGFVINNRLVQDNYGNTYWKKKVGNYDVIYKTTPTGETTQLTNKTFEDIRWMHFSKNDNHLYVVDMLTVKKVLTNGEVTLVSNNLKENKKAHAGVGDHHYIMGVWTDRKQNAYVATFGERKIKKINSNGNQSTFLTSSFMWSPSGGLIANDGSLWVLEYSRTNKARVRQVKPNGEESIFQE